VVIAGGGWENMLGIPGGGGFLGDVERFGGCGSIWPCLGGVW
jgi:hypothetical protein